MNDTDRLAALLRATVEALWDTPGDPADIDASVDRLIAAGVTLAPTPRLACPVCTLTTCACFAAGVTLAPTPPDALRARISLEAINGVRPVWIAEGLFEKYAARTAEGWPVTIAWGEPDADGFYNPTFTENPTP